mmetsp:Transcript_15354/g.35932  ORF Transcript_15354/g.35932 Transcript_15354/m.35932 type:complete len:243 (+) Transcript_15354:305-1033(+)
MSTFKQTSKYSRERGASKTKVRNWPPSMMRVAEHWSSFPRRGTPTCGNQASSGGQMLSMDLKATGCCAFGTCRTRWVSSESSLASAKQVHPSSNNTLTLMPFSNARVKARSDAWRHCRCSSAGGAVPDSAWIAVGACNIPPRTLSNSGGTTNTPGLPLLGSELPTQVPRGCGTSSAEQFACAREPPAGTAFTAGSANTETCSSLSIHAVVSISGSSLQPQHGNLSSALQNACERARSIAMAV